MDNHKIKASVNLEIHDDTVRVFPTVSGSADLPENWSWYRDLRIDCSGDPEGRNGVRFHAFLAEQTPPRSVRIKIEADDVPEMVARIAENHFLGEQGDDVGLKTEQLADLVKKLLAAVAPYQDVLDDEDVDGEANRLVAAVVGAAADWKRGWVAAHHDRSEDRGIEKEPPRRLSNGDPWPEPIDHVRRTPVPTFPDKRRIMLEPTSHVRRVPGLPKQ